MDRRTFLKMATLLACGSWILPRTAGSRPAGFEPAPRRVEVRNCRRSTAKEMAAVGGWWIGPTFAPGFHGLSRYHEQFRQRCLEAKRRNPEVKILASVRFELFARYEEANAKASGWPAYQGGFRDEWICWLDRNAWLQDMEPWLDAGFEIRPGWHVDRGWLDRVWDLRPGHRPVTYVLIHHPTPRQPGRWLRTNQVVVDVADAAYQDWLVEELRWGVSHIQADGLFVGTKAGFWRHNPKIDGQELRILPGGVWSYLEKEWNRPGPFSTTGCVTRSPYGPGQFERGMSDIFVKLAGRGIRCVTLSRPAASSGHWAPYTAAAREVLLGEGDTV